MQDRIFYGAVILLSAVVSSVIYRRKRDKLHPEVEMLRAGNPWCEHPQYPRDDWRFEAAANDTQLGYWEWVSHQIENRDSFTPVK